MALHRVWQFISCGALSFLQAKGVNPAFGRRGKLGWPDSWQWWQRAVEAGCFARRPPRHCPTSLPAWYQQPIHGVDLGQKTKSVGHQFGRHKGSRNEPQRHAKCTEADKKEPPSNLESSLSDSYLLWDGDDGTRALMCIKLTNVFLPKHIASSHLYDLCICKLGVSKLASTRPISGS